MSQEGSPPQREPSDPRYADSVRESFARQRIMSTLGASLAAVAPGRVEIRLPFRDMEYGA